MRPLVRVPFAVLLFAASACSTEAAGLGTEGNLDETGADAGGHDTVVPDGEDSAPAFDTTVIDVADTAGSDSDLVDDGVSADTVVPDLGPDGCATLCAAKCVDLATDGKNCGSCATVCDPDYGKYSSCVASKCDCPAGTGLCAKECKDGSLDAVNCGACGVKCAKDQACSGSKCGCRPGLTKCTLGSVDLCVDIKGDERACGGCSGACSGSDKCIGSSCSGGSCPSGRTGCGKSCFDLNRDPTHCGGCGTVCNFDQVCVAGTCKHYDPAVGGAINCAKMEPSGKDCTIGGALFCVEGGVCPGSF